MLIEKKERKINVMFQGGTSCTKGTLLPPIMKYYQALYKYTEYKMHIEYFQNM